MFSNFKEAFSDEPKYTTNIPEAVLETLSKDLPAGLNYVEDKDGFCRIDAPDGLHISASKFQFNSEDAELFPESDPTFQDVVFFAYNAQKSVEILPMEDGCILINGKKMRIDDFVKAPLKADIRIDKGHLFIIPPPFPPPFQLELSGNGYSTTLLIQRQPINSRKQISFSSIGEGALSLSCKVDTSVPKREMNFSISLKQAGSAYDVMASKEIYNAFVTGNGVLGGAVIRDVEKETNKLIPEEVVRFWHKVVEVERITTSEFDISQELSTETVMIINELYRSLIEKKPYKKLQNKVTINGSGRFVLENKEIFQEGKEVLFEYIEGLEFHVFGSTIRTYALVDVFGGVFAELDIPEDEEGVVAVTLIPAEGKKMFTATQYYIDEQEIEAVHADRGHIEVFKQSEPLNCK